MRTWSLVSVPTLPASPVAPRLYDTARSATVPVDAGPTARMYVCGITPYDATHLGHAATYLAFDLLYRQWLDNGHEVAYVQNVTDVDDPLLERAARDGVDWARLAERETELFRRDMEALRVLPPRDYVGAVESIGEITVVIGKLLADGVAYRVDDPEHPDIYFDHTRAPRFGERSRLDHATMLTLFGERGGDPDRPGKRHPLDALLWRAAREGEPSWDGELGPGRPGWHVECSVIAVNRLGMGFDVQGGGSDLVFPHHEFSAAHAETATGTHPFARLYCHAGMIGLDGEKMSKSRGNLVLVSRLREAGVDPMAIRLALLAGHYRTDRAWTDGLLTTASDRLDRWRAAVARPAGAPAAPVLAAVRERLADDLDSPSALRLVDDWACAPGSDPDAPALIADLVDALLGVNPR